MFILLVFYAETFLTSKRNLHDPEVTPDFIGRCAALQRKFW
jgi:hypothetical protein